MISLSKVSKFYESQEVFSELSLTFNTSTTHSIVGSSGSGKTTLLNLISGLDSYNNGKVIVDGQILHTLSSDEKSMLRRKFFGFAYQFHYLLENLTIYENCIASNFGKHESSIDDILKKLCKGYESII